MTVQVPKTYQLVKAKSSHYALELVQNPHDNGTDPHQKKRPEK
jgi:hypothetical protein